MTVAGSVRPAVGSVAPDFTLSSSAREPVTLSSFRGRQHVLLAFFPMAFTSTCTEDLCEMGEDYEQYARHDVQVLGISCDLGPALAAFKAARNIGVELLSDARREVSRAYGVMREDDGFSERAYVLIDREGILRWMHVEAELGHRRGTAELLRQLEALG